MGWSELKMSHQSGTTKGYRSEFMDPLTDKWKQIEWKQRYHPHGVSLEGVPFPLISGGILSEAWLMGYAQAQAVAWAFAADYEATQYRSIEVRIVSFDVKYSIEYEPTKTSDAVELPEAK